MKIKLTFLGGVQSVTGSRYLVEVNNTRFLVDCGLVLEILGHKGGKKKGPGPRTREF